MSYILLKFFLCASCVFSHFFFFNDPATTEIYTLSLHDALPIYAIERLGARVVKVPFETWWRVIEEHRSEEHTSELQSLTNLVCRLLLEKKNSARAPELRIQNYRTCVANQL